LPSVATIGHSSAPASTVVPRNSIFVVVNDNSIGHWRHFVWKWKFGADA